MTPLRHFTARAMPTDDARRWRACFGFPGGVDDYVRDPDGRPTEYPSESAAEVAAYRTLVRALNARPRWSWRNHHRRIGPDAFALGLAEAGLTATDATRLWGTRLQRVRAWMTGEEQVPFPWHWCLALLADPGAAERALRIADENTETQQEREHAREGGDL